MKGCLNQCTIFEPSVKNGGAPWRVPRVLYYVIFTHNHDGIWDPGDDLPVQLDRSLQHWGQQVP